MDMNSFEKNYKIVQQGKLTSGRRIPISKPDEQVKFFFKK